MEPNKQLFGTENITVIFWWSEDKGALYDLVVLPQASIKIYNSSTIIVLTLQYNVLYNVSAALSLCGHISTDTLKLNYGEAFLDFVCQLTDTYYTVKCSYPLLSDDSVIIAAGYRDPALADSVLQFRCKDGLFPSEVFTATCLKDGRWYPDPTKHNCTMSLGIIILCMHSDCIVVNEPHHTKISLISRLFLSFSHKKVRESLQMRLYNQTWKFGVMRLASCDWSSLLHI